MRNVFFKIYKAVRGASVESGGHRDLSSGFLSDGIRETVVRECVSAPGLLLEVGCGEGIFLSQLSNQYQGLLFGIERVHNMMIRAKRRFLKKSRKEPTVLSAKGEQLPFKNEAFDCVVCVNTFHNQPSMADVGSILKDMARVCKTGGRVIFDIRNSSNPIMFLAYKFANLYDPSCKVLPLNTYSFSRIARVLRTLGFSVEKKTPVLFPFVLLAPAIVIKAGKRK